MDKIQDKYSRLCRVRSDINEHLPTLKEYAEKCDHVTEMGVRRIVSTWALLAGSPKYMVSIDIQHPKSLGANIDEVYLLTKGLINFELKIEDTTKNKIEKTDLLFIDTLHHYDQLKAELKHAANVRKYIILHDTVTFGINGQDGKEGLRKAIDEFLRENNGWVIEKEFKNNNGLTILKRRSKLSIGITTYKYRFDEYLKPLIGQIREKDDVEIILGVNGEYKEGFDNAYREGILQFCAGVKDVYPFIYPNFRSLAKMWNNIIINATGDYVLILNDDMVITDEHFFDRLNQEIEKFQCNFRMGAHYSMFVIRKDTLLPSQYFDERFLGIGAEDWEYKRRISKSVCNMETSNYEGMLNFSDKKHAAIGHKSNGGYSLFNLSVYNRNLPPKDQYPYEDFYLKNYDQI